VFTHLCLGLPSGLVPSGFLTNILYASPNPHSCYIPANLILLDLITYAEGKILSLRTTYPPHNYARLISFSALVSHPTMLQCCILTLRNPLTILF
jgi:hypothetical protein